MFNLRAHWKRQKYLWFLFPGVYIHSTSIKQKKKKEIELQVERIQIHELRVQNDELEGLKHELKD